MKKFWAIRVKSSISDSPLDAEGFVQGWAKKLGGKYQNGSFLDDIWGLLLFPTKDDAYHFIKFMGEFGFAHYLGKPSNKYWIKIRGIHRDWWLRGTGKRIEG